MGHRGLRTSPTRDLTSGNKGKERSRLLQFLDLITHASTLRVYNCLSTCDVHSFWSNYYSTCFLCLLLLRVGRIPAVWNKKTKNYMNWLAICFVLCTAHRGGCPWIQSSVLQVSRVNELDCDKLPQAPFLKFYFDFIFGKTSYCAHLEGQVNDSLFEYCAVERWLGVPSALSVGSNKSCAPHTSKGQ